MGCRSKNSGSSDGKIRRLPNPGGAGYVLDVQANLLGDLSTRVVVPLVPSSTKVKAVRKLNPMLTVNGKQYFMFTHLIAAIPTSRLQDPTANLAQSQDQIVGALDMLFQGF